VAKVGTGGTISQQAVVHPWLAADAHVNKQTAEAPSGEIAHSIQFVEVERNYFFRTLLTIQ
jgi:hypothetical protein